VRDKPPSSMPSDVRSDRFQIGDEDLLVPAAAPEVGQVETSPAAGMSLHERLADVRVRVGTLLKTETVSFLLGAGASVECGGQLIGTVPLPVESALQEEGISGSEQPRIRRWLRIFYLAARCAGGGDSVPILRESIRDRRNALAGEGGEPLQVNLEHVLALLYRWRSAMPASGGRLRIDSSPPIDVKVTDLNESLSHVTRALARACDLPMRGKESGLGSLKTLLRKLLTRPLNLKRVNIFTLNYDTLIEQAADAEGIVLLDGLVGTQRRTLRPESYEQDLYFPAETTEGRVHRFDRVLHLYKIHGSITWTAEPPTIDNPYGIVAKDFDPDSVHPSMIFPTPAKYGETLGMPYAEMFRRFATALVRPQSVLFVVGYGFGDEHVNTLIQQALAVPSFTLVIVDPHPKSEFVTRVRVQKDRRIWIVEGPVLGKLSGFVNEVLPDLRDEEIRMKVLATHRALSALNPVEEVASHGD